MNGLFDKVVLITGASSGFGADMARLFAKEGSIVLLGARRKDRLDALAEEICEAGGRAAVMVMDVSKQAQIDEVVHQALTTYGRIDVLINNAGGGRLDWLEALDAKHDIDPQLDANLRGLILVTRAVLPSMIAHHSGTIINMSSVAGYIPAPMYSIYAASKFGVRGFTNALRRELKPLGVHVCGIYPGPAVTEFSKHTGTDSAIRKRLKVPAWLYMTSDYVADKVLNLARHPRATMVIPWWFRLLIALDAILPGMVDWLVNEIYVKKWHTR